MAGQWPKCPVKEWPPAPLSNQVATREARDHRVQASRAKDTGKQRSREGGGGGKGEAVLSWLNQVPTAGPKRTLTLNAAARHIQLKGHGPYEASTSRPLQRTLSRHGLSSAFPYTCVGERPGRGGLGTHRVTPARPALSTADSLVEGCKGTGHRRTHSWQTHRAPAHPPPGQDCPFSPPSLPATSGPGPPSSWPPVCSWGHRALTPPPSCQDLQASLLANTLFFFSSLFLP